MTDSTIPDTAPTSHSDTSETRQPIMADWMRRGELGTTVRKTSRRWWHTLARHLAWLPVYIGRLLKWSPRGLGRSVAWLWRALLDEETKGLQRHHAGQRDTSEYVALERIRKERVHNRLVAFCVIVAVITVGFLLLWLLVSPALFWAVSVAVLLVLGWIGRPRDTRLLNAVPLVDGAPPPVSAPMVREALCAIGIPRMTDPESIGVLMDVARTAGGYQVGIELPKGVEANDVIEKRSKLAAALRRDLGTVWPGQGSRHVAHLDLYIADEPVSSAKQRHWPLMEKGQTNIFDPIPMFTDQRGQWVDQKLAYMCGVVGGIPGSGKTFYMRQIGLVFALDPRTQIYAYDLKSTGDFGPLSVIAHGYGLNDEEKDTIKQLEELTALHDDMRRRVKVIRKLAETDRALCPENKVTDQLASMPEFKLHPVLLLVDECFPAGTMVGGRPIESVKPGDIIPSWDETTGEMCERPVVATMKKPPEALIRVRFMDGSSVVCTPNHPFMTSAGWLEGGRLTQFSEVLSYGQAGDTDRSAVLDLQETIHPAAIQTAPLEEDRPRHLLPGMLAPVLQGPETGMAAGEPGADGAAQAGEQPNERPCGSGQGVSETAGHEASPTSAGREWSRADGTAATFSRGAGLADRGHRPQWEGASGVWRAAALQAGHRQSAADDRYRGGRTVARLDRSEGARRAQDRVAYWTRVDRVEVLQPGSDGRYGGLCPDGLVYNFEVEGTHTYLVGDGFVVHNCQEWFEHSNNEMKKEFIRLCTDFVKRGRAAGIHAFFGTQKPDMKSLPSPISANAGIRFCLRVTTHHANDAVLGTGAHSSGFNATVLTDKDRGMGYLRGESSEPQIVRTVKGLDGLTAETIALRARAVRQAQGRLSGYAAGEDITNTLQQVNFLADCRQVLGSSDAIHLVDLAEGLAALRHRAYSSLNSTSVGQMLRELDIEPRVVYDASKGRERGNGQGVRRQQLQVSATDPDGDEDTREREPEGMIAAK